MSNKIRLASDITHDSVVDGPGIRSVIWTQGCPHNCPECHNPQTHDFNGGFFMEISDVIDNLLKENKDVTFSGGDPFCQPKECAEIANAMQMNGYSVWAYSGWTYEQLLEKAKSEPAIIDFLKNVDYLVDGPFVLSKKNLLLLFRGSSNQRIIDVQKSLAQGKTIVSNKYTDNYELKTEKPDGIFL